jgi:hypothetical protein
MLSIRQTYIKLTKSDFAGGKFTKWPPKATATNG